MEFSDRIRQEVEKIFTDQSDILVDQLFGRIDRRLQRAIEDLLEEALGSLVSSVGTSGTTGGIANGSDALEGNFSSGFNARIGNLFTAALEVGIAQATERTTTRTAETSRSRLENEEFRTSRAQQQAVVTDQANRGRRNS